LATTASGAGPGAGWLGLWWFLTHQNLFCYI
jgi:hypothetical protein